MARESPMQTSGPSKARVKLAEPDSVSVEDNEPTDDDAMDKDELVVPRQERKNGAPIQVSERLTSRLLLVELQYCNVIFCIRFFLSCVCKTQCCESWLISHLCESCTCTCLLAPLITWAVLVFFSFFMQLRPGLAENYEGEKSGREEWWRTYIRVGI